MGKGKKKKFKENGHRIYFQNGPIEGYKWKKKEKSTVAWLF